MRRLVPFLASPFLLVAIIFCLSPVDGLGKEAYRFVAEWGKGGSGNGQFIKPVAIAVGKDNTLYVVDQDNRRIQTFTTDGSFVRAWDNTKGPMTETEGRFRVPSGVAADAAGNVYVAEWGKSRVQAFTSEGVFLRKWGGQGRDQGLFAFPTGVAVSEDGFVYVADTDNARIQKFCGDGTFVTQFSFTGCLPNSLAVAPDGHVLVIDTRGRYWSFTAEGTLLGWRGRGVRVEDGSGRRTGWFDPDETFTYTKKTGFWVETGPFDGDGEFFEPRGIAVDRHGNVFVADTRNHRIQKFAPDGTFLCKWGSRGKAPGQFDFPYAVAVGSNDTVYVTDKYNNRIQTFTQIP